MARGPYAWLYEQEDKPKRNIAVMLRKKDQEMAKEQAWNRANVCPKCNIVLTTTGACSMGCGYHKGGK